MALFVLGMAVQHRAQTVNWPALWEALHGRSPAAAGTPAVAPAPASTALPTPSATSAPAIAPQAPAQALPATYVRAPETGRPLDDLPPPLTSAHGGSLLDRLPTLPRRPPGRAARAEIQPAGDEEEPVSVEIRSSRAAAASPASAEAVDVTLAAADQSPLHSPAASAAPKQAFKAVTTNGSALVIRSTAGNRFQQVAPGERLPDGQTLSRVDDEHGSYTTDAGTFKFGASQ